MPRGVQGSSISVRGDGSARVLRVGRSKQIYIYIYIYVYVSVYIYIYLYAAREAHPITQQPGRLGRAASRRCRAP